MTTQVPADGISDIVLKDFRVFYYVPDNKRFGLPANQGNITPVISFHAVFKSKKGKTEDGGHVYAIDGMTAPKSKKIRKVILVALLPCCLIFWFVSAPATMAVQRIVSGGNGGPFASFVCKVTDWYQSPMVIVCKIQFLRTAGDRLEDRWCEVLQAPETTP